PLELMYSTLVKSSKTRSRSSLDRPSYVPSTASRDPLDMSPTNRTMVNAWPLAPVVFSTLAFVSVCILTRSLCRAELRAAHNYRLRWPTRVPIPPHRRATGSGTFPIRAAALRREFCDRCSAEAPDDRGLALYPQ